MHGHSYSLRADYSLDSPPPHEDRDSFVQYFLNARNVGSTLPAKNNLLVMGLSGNELRTRAFLEHIWKRQLNDFTVFWIAHRREDLLNTFRLFQELVSSSKTTQQTYVLRHTNPGLLLLRVFQHFRYTLPTFGALFPSANYLPLPPLFNPAHVDKYQAETFRDQLANAIAELASVDGNDLTRIVIVHSDPSKPGVTSVCAQLCELLEDTSVPIWLDMSDVRDTGDLFEQLLVAMHYRLGDESWLPATPFADAALRAEVILDLAKKSTKKWVVFLNAREKPGSNYPSNDDALDNGWLDNDRRIGEFVDFLSEVVFDQSKSPFIVVLMLNGEDPPILVRLREDLELLTNVHEFKLPANFSNLKRSEIVNKCVTFYTPKSNQVDIKKRAFLHRLVLMQRSRYLSSIWEHYTKGTEATLSHDEMNVRNDWLNDLEQTGLIRRQLGGFIWLLSDERNILRNKLAEGSDGATEAAQLHWDIALAYEKVLAVSAAPLALCEAVYHALSAAECTRERKKRLGHITWATGLLKRNKVRVHTFGYSQGTLRRLEFVRDFEGFAKISKWLNMKDRTLVSALRDFQNSCSETMRQIALDAGACDEAERHHKKISETNDHLQEIRNKKWESRLYRHWRSYSAALNSAWQGLVSANVIRETVWDDKALEQYVMDKATNALSDGGTNPKSSTDRLHLEVMRIIEVYLANRLQLLAIQPNETSLKTCGGIAEHAMYYVDGLRTRTSDPNIESGYNVVRVRLLVHQSQIAVLLGRGPDSMRILTDADSLLNFIEHYGIQSERSIVDLYRAEARLIDASNTIVGPPDKNNKFGSFVEMMCKGCAYSRFDSQAIKESIQQFGLLPDLPNPPAILREPLALIQDAMRFLNRSKAGLVARRRHTHWLTWSIHRTIRGMAWNAWATIFSNQAIPFLGPEAAPEHLDCEPDRLIKTAQMLSGDDAYRLAHILNEYSSLAVALKCRLIFDRQSPRLRVRQINMCDNIATLRQSVDRARNRRDSHEPLMDELVGQFIDQCLLTARVRLRSLRRLRR